MTINITNQIAATVALLYCNLLAGCGATSSQAKQSLPEKSVEAFQTRVEGQPTQGRPRVETFNEWSGDYTLTMRLEEMPVEFDNSPYWGATNSTAMAIVSLRLRYKGAPIDVPRSSFSDLSNVGEIQLTDSDGSLSVRLTGGDGSEGWNAVIRFEQGRITERRVEWSSFPENDFEITKYHYSNPFPD